MSEQKGVFRVNCIDCLDRTNVVQVVMSFTKLVYVIDVAVSLLSPELS